MSQEETGQRAIPDQIEYWNTEAGRAWVARQQSWDTAMKPFSDAALIRAAVRPGERVIDIGCGCGATSLQLAELVGPKGSVLGVDVSKPMLARAKERGAGNPVLRFAEADATTYPFERAAADLLFSRHGVMFFAEPERAFANLRTALKPGGRVAFSCFRTPKENGLITTILAAVSEFVPPLPKMNPDDPGPFAFQDPERVKRILSAAGFTGVALEPVDVQSDISNGQGMAEALVNAMEIGPASRALQGAAPEVHAKAKEALRTVFTPLQKDGKVLLGAGIWIVTAGNG
ncbi:class I SAM-dependent methyltransferase [Dongia sedimenti]|uniref:Class I SAM-dependent methyltransferase n=1 Tax=Dongia sedimenti TaxID=3064282 RepID=A0ABU0YMI3_9PROT|nr:class I SAM-dependent methyltransferase [Rhodospirillaceae bacterium R-7]